MNGKKFRAFRYFWFLCSVFFLFNIWTLSEKMKMEMYDAGAVKQIYADLKAQPEEKRKEWIEKLPEKKVPVYTGNEYAEEMLYNKIFQEYRQVNRYDKYLEEIKEKSASMSSAIFSNEGTFAYRNAQITPDAYEKLKGLKLKSDVSDGVIFATEAEFTDLCIVFMLAVTVYFLVLDEKKNKLYPLLRSCYRGRGSVIGAKLTVAACVTALLVLLFYGVDYLYAWQKYGFGDLSRPIQSVTTMYESPYMMSVGMFLFLYLIVKMAVCYVIILGMIWIAQKSETPSGAMIGIGAVGIAEYMLSAFLPSVSYADVFKYVNLAEYMKVYPLFSKYHNLDFFDNPVNAMTVFRIVLPVVLVLFVLGNVRRFFRCAKTKRRWRRERKNSSRIGFISDKLYFYESVKCLFSNRAIWVCIAVMYGAVLVGNSIPTYRDIKEEYYKFYMTDQQGKMTEELKEKILLAETLVTVEDLYRPYRPKRRTRATIAKEKGLEPLAAYMMLQQAKEPLEETAKQYISEEKEVKTEEEAIAGAKDIIAEIISDNADYRTWIRKTTMKKGKVVSTAKDPETESVYEMYYEFEESVEKLAGHRILALNRGEKEKFLTIKVAAPEEDILRYLEKQVITRDNPFTTPILKEVTEDSYKRLIAPAIEREIRSDLTEKAEDGAIKVFGKNLEQLLMQPPIAGQTVLGWDPAFRTGCKLAVVDPTGKVLDTTVVYPTAPTNEKKIRAAKDTVEAMIKKYGISLISVGNGTASRESEQVIVDMLKEIPEAKVQYVITNEAGASVYSASKLATDEFPNFDVGQRSATSIARRVQDPLAELVKIDPKSIGVGQYQHDMNQKKLGEALTGVVEDSGNKVGVDLNTASASLLEYISGVSKAIAKNIVIYREENGRFTSRKDLLKVAKLGPKAFEQCAGFMRITGGSNPLDATSVHPESYEAASRLLEKLGYSAEDIAGGKLAGLSRQIRDYKKTADELEIGEITLRDIVKELEKPARDPRDEMPKPILRTDVLDIKDLKEGMILKGTVRNVIDFGAFVDIGVHQDGLVHISQMSEKFIKHPLEAVSVGDVVEVRVLGVDEKKNRISLSMKGLNK